jgi:hypothetical protein
VQRIAAVLGAVLGVLVAATTLIDWISNRGSDEPPATIDARVLSVTRTSVAETLGDYVRDTAPAKKPPYTPEQLRETGYVFEVRVSIEGQLEQRLPLRWAMYSGAGGRRLGGDTYNQVAATFTPEGTRHSRTWPVWIPYPPAEGRYFVRFVLADADGRPVDERDSEPFRYVPEGDGL